MLQPSESPARPAEGFSLPEERREDSKRTEKTSIWRWISVRELVFIFVACSVGAALFQTQDDVKYVGGALARH